jgi:hypothetical protein
MHRLVLLLAAAAVAVAAVPSIADAAPPVNDEFPSATAIGSLPFSESVDLTEAGSEPGEPSCTSPAEEKTVWYAVTLQEHVVVRARVSSASQPMTLLAARAAGPAFSDLVDVQCRYSGEALVFEAHAGETWYVRAASYPFYLGGSLTIELETVDPPANDSFAAAKAIESLPYSDTVDATAGTNEDGEPSPSCGGSSPRSVWYSYTPAADGWLTATGPWAGNYEIVTAYTGGSIDDLAEIVCRTFPSQFTLRVDTGTTYYFQVGSYFGDAGPLRFDLAVAAAPVASFGYWPSDPSAFDNLQMSSFSYDPGGNPIVSHVWDYGDGTPPTESSSHRYARDGDYTIALTVETSDGRTGFSTQVISVRTHDVAIKKLDTPRSARPGRTKSVTVGITNTRLPETVDVLLFKSIPGGDFEQVGSQRISLPVRGRNRATNVTFTVSFTDADAAVGKVSFKATVVLVGARDAIPADNTVVAAPPTIVR